MATGSGRLSGCVRGLRERAVWELGGLFSLWVELPESFAHPKRRRLFSPLAHVLALPRAGALGG